MRCYYSCYLSRGRRAGKRLHPARRPCTAYARHAWHSDAACCLATSGGTSDAKHPYQGQATNYGMSSCTEARDGRRTMRGRVRQRQLVEEHDGVVARALRQARAGTGSAPPRARPPASCPGAPPARPPAGTPPARNHRCSSQPSNIAERSQAADNEACLAALPGRPCRALRMRSAWPCEAAYVKYRYSKWHLMHFTCNGC